MHSKPDSCTGCPWYQTGKGYVADDTREGIPVWFLNGSPDHVEEDTGKTAQGQAGSDLVSNFLPLAGVVWGETAQSASVLKCRWQGHDVPPGDATQSLAVGHCTRHHLQVPRGTTLIVAQGKIAFTYAHGGTLRDPSGKPASHTDWRGFLLPLQYTRAQFGEIPVYVTMGIMDLYQNPGMETVTEWDYLKIRSIRDGRYPRPLPSTLICTADNKPDYRAWFLRARHARWVTCDTEFIPRTKHLTILGLLARFADGTVSGLQVDWRHAHPSVREEIKYHYRLLVKDVRFIFHNCRADIPVLEVQTGVGFSDYKQYEDTMLAHAVLWCELPHGLEFIASVWGQYPKLKHLKTDDEMVYNFGDVLETDAIWLYIEEESFKHDPQAEHIYRSQHLKLAPLLHRTVHRGLRINHTRVREARLTYENDVAGARRLALATAGWPINLNSPKQLAQYLYDVRGFEVQVNRKTDAISINDDAIATLRMALGPYFDPEDALTYEKALERITNGADPILEARVLYSGASTRLIKYIYSLYTCVAGLSPFDFTSKGAYEKAWTLGIQSILDGTETTLLDRMHPDMLTHTQKTGRWSTVDPPIAQLPIELRDIICPDPGEVWIAWDWSAIEPRILEGYCGSRILRRAFDEGIDLHTWTCCAAFGYEFPPDLIDPHTNPLCEAWRTKYKWKGKDDPRRVFAKTARYEMYYGGTGNNAAASAALFGLDLKTLKRACQQLISTDPEYAQWRMNLEDTIKRTRVLRTFMGRPRRFLKGGHKMVREGLDQPMQGGVSDIANTTVVALDTLQIPGLQFSWSMHDSQFWALPQAQCTRAFLGTMRRIVERPHMINGRSIPFPAHFHVIDDQAKDWELDAYFAAKEVR